MLLQIRERERERGRGRRRQGLYSKSPWHGLLDARSRLFRPQSRSAAALNLSRNLPCPFIFQKAMGPISSSPSLNVATQVRFWLRCLKTFLPNAYTEQEASRIPLAFFTLSALDVLNSLDTHTTPAERAEWADFLYSCQHPGGGFRAFTGSKYGDRPTTAENARWDPANIAGTYFAIVSLIILGDDLKRVQRQKTLEWIGRLQHPDGSFGELLAGNGSVDGGQDVRFCFLAALICRILDSGDVQDAFGPYIDQEDLAKFVLTSKVCSICALSSLWLLTEQQAYDGGMARKPYCESHGTPCLAPSQFARVCVETWATA